jgi:hypothetical protein
MQTGLWLYLWWGLTEFAFGGSLESGDRFCVGVFGRNLVSVAVKMFSHLIFSSKKFDGFCTFNAICKDNSAINCVIVQHKGGSFASTLTGHAMLVYNISMLNTATADHCYNWMADYRKVAHAYHYTGWVACFKTLLSEEQPR